jgi:FG-GAP-like repeat/Divergent InlB B-repeat domain
MKNVFVTLLYVGCVHSAMASVTFFGPANYPVGTGPVAAVVGDFNGDGKLDVAVANSGSDDISILLGNGDGTFKPATNFSAGGSSPVSIATGDFNRDGKQDLAVALQGSGVTVLLGNGDGTFRAAQNVITTDQYPAYVAVGDFNGDGKADLVVAMLSFGISVFIGNGDGTFQSSIDYTLQGPVNSIAVGDLNGDHIPDLVLATGGIGGLDSLKSSGAVSILLGNGDGTFQAPTSYGDPTEEVNFVALGDFDGDGRLDVAAVTTLFDHPEFQPIKTFKCFQRLFLGNGDGTLQSALSLNTADRVDGLFITAVDLNSDSKADMAVLEGGVVPASSLIVLEGNGDGTFQVSGYDAEAAVSLAAGDLDHDGALDLVLVNQSDDTVGVLLNSNGNPSFALTVSVSTSTAGAGTITGSPGEINCPISNCSVTYAVGTIVTLTATASAGSTFAGWSGACTSNGSCIVVMNSDQAVTATFNSTAPPDFSLTASALTPSTVTAGQSATGTVTVSAIGSFSGTVTFSCSVLPSPSHAPSCEVTPSGSGASVTVMTTAPTFARTAASPSAWVFAAWIPLLGLVLTAVRRSPAHSRKFFTCLLCVAILAGIAFQMACGGNSQMKSVAGGTPPGSYTVTLTGISGSIQHSTVMTLSVQ